MSKWIEAGKTYDINSLLNLCSDDFLYIGVSGRKYCKDEVKEAFSRIKSIWPDRKIIINRWVSQGNTIWIEWTGKMTHVNEYRGIPPTNKRVEFSGVHIVEVEAGRIKQLNEYETSPEYLLNQLRE
jgi:steroid delta-isomerase-like uncharacterized protein